MNIQQTSQPLATIEFLTGPHAGQTHSITKTLVTIGRDPSSDIVISEHEKSVSRRHAQIFWNNGFWTIKNLSSGNKVLINQHEVQEHPLHNRDTIALGTGITTFIFLYDNEMMPTLHDTNATTPEQVPFSAGPLSPLPSAASPASFIPSTPRSVSPPMQPPAPKTQIGQPASPAPFAERSPQQGPLILHAGNEGMAFTPHGQTVDTRVQQEQQLSFPVAEEPGSFTAPHNPTSMAQPPIGPQQQATNLVVGPMGTERADLGSIGIGRGVPTLEITNNSNAQRRTQELNKAVINIGRDPRNDIVLETPTVSSLHMQIVREGGQYVLLHPHPERSSTVNGLIYNGRVIKGSERFREVLKRGDVIRISDMHDTYVALKYNDNTGPVRDILPEIRPIPLNKPTITIGRIPGNDVVLNHPQVSSRHARLEQAQGGYRIVDQNSTNGVYVNAKRISGKQLLKPNDEIRVGPFKLTYTGTQLTQYDERNSIRIDAVNIKREGDKHKVLINNISLVIEPRSFVAIVGGSGAGKSTLMDALNGRRPAQTGKVYYNGQDYYEHLAAFSTQLGYVPQKDIIHNDLSVERALYYAAKLRLPDDYTDAQIQERIKEVLEDVDMVDRRSLLIKKLSGGQQKRVSIALELLANPSVFFLDEPTSGLDPGLDRKMMALLRKLADRGRTIVLVTHATNNINFCDRVCFLCKGGRLAFYGTPDEAKRYFDKTDFAEIYSELEPTSEKDEEPIAAEVRFKKSEEYRRYIDGPLRMGPASGQNVLAPTAAVKQPKRGDPWKQFRLLSMRYLELLKNDFGNLAILLLQAPAIGLILFALASQATFVESSVVTCPPNSQIPRTVANSSSCQNEINAFNTPQGQTFMQQKGFATPIDATQQFITPGSGQDAQKILLIMAFAAVMFGCINGAREIVKESSIYQRERAVNLGIVPYMFSKIAVLGVFCLVQSGILVLMVNVKAPFHHSTFLPPLLEIYITLALTSLAGLMLGLTLSAIVENNDRAMSFVPIILIPQIIFSGAIFALNNPVLQFIGAFFAAHWAMAGMGSTVGLHGDKVLPGDNFIYASTLFSPTTQAEAVLHLLLTWSILGIIIVVLGFAIAYFLKKKDVRA